MSGPTARGALLPVKLPDTGWMDRALCRGDAEFAELPAKDQEPTCVRCPVRLECVEYALAQLPINKNSTVAYAGVDPRELARLAKPRRREARARIREEAA